MLRNSLKKQLFDLGFDIKKISGDGNCLFRCFAHQINGEPDTHLFYRNLAVQYMRKSPSDFAHFLSQEEAKDFDDYLKRMMRPSEYGGHLEIQALSRSLNLEVNIHEENKKPYSISNGRNGKKIELVYLRSKLHYDSVTPFNSLSETSSRNKSAQRKSNTYNKQPRIRAFSQNTSNTKQRLDAKKEKIMVVTLKTDNKKTTTQQAANNKIITRSQSLAERNSQQSVPCKSRKRKIECLEFNKLTPEESCEPKPQCKKAKLTQEKARINFDWKLIPPKGHFSAKLFTERKNNSLNIHKDLKDLTEPYEFIDLFFNDEVLQNIVTFTNNRAKILLKNQNKDNKNSHVLDWKDIDIQELKAYLAMTIHMGITSCPELKFYWSSDEKFRIPGIASVMSRDKFLNIRRCIYYNEDKNEEDIEAEDSLRKIRVLYDSISNTSEKYWIKNSKLAIDESMVQFEGDHSETVYVPRKPIKQGFKIFVLADRYGYAIKFIPSIGRGKDTTKQIVLDLLGDKYDSEGHHLYFDRYFTTIELVKILQRKQFHVTAAIQSNRLPALLQGKDKIEKLKLNELLFWKYHDDNNKLILSAWLDKKLCCHVSTYHTNEIVSPARSLRSIRRAIKFDRIKLSQRSKSAEFKSQRGVSGSDELNNNNDHSQNLLIPEERMSRSQGNKKGKSHSVDGRPNAPLMLVDYSQNMCGVDIFNHRCSTYNFPHRSVKWYRSIVNWLVEVAINNAHQLYIHARGNKLSSLQFRQNIIKQWQKDYLDITKRRLPAATPTPTLDKAAYECRLIKGLVKGGCDYCYDRYNNRRETKYVCASKNCVIEPQRKNLAKRSVRVHPECFHLHLKHQA